MPAGKMVADLELVAPAEKRRRDRRHVGIGNPHDVLTIAVLIESAPAEQLRGVVKGRGREAAARLNIAVQIVPRSAELHVEQQLAGGRSAQLHLGVPRLPVEHARRVERCEHIRLVLNVRFALVLVPRRRDDELIFRGHLV